MSADQDREALNFFISCFMCTDTPRWAEVAQLNGIGGTATNSAAKTTQRKFKRLVEASGIYALDSGKVVLKKGVGGGSAPPSQSTKTQNGSTTPATPGTGKKRGRPPGSGKASARKGGGKKVKDQDEGVDAEAQDLHQTPSKRMRTELETGGTQDEDQNGAGKGGSEAEADAEEEAD